MTLSILIPTRNESASIAALLLSVQLQLEPTDELLVIDGHSTDSTRVTVTNLGIRCISAEGGRGGQLASGIHSTGGTIIVMLHADMQLPADALTLIRRACNNPDIVGGSLGHRFDDAGIMFRLIEGFDRSRARRGLPYGDQAIFFRRDALVKIGGFPDSPIMEDLELSRRLRRVGRMIALERPVLVSSRQFRKRGILTTLLRNWAFRRAYSRGGIAACAAIHREYYSGPSTGLLSTLLSLSRRA